MMKTAAVAALGLTLLAGSALAADLTPTQIIQRHMDFAGKGDVDSVVGDYADDAVVIVNGQATQGKAEIKTMFQRMMGGGAGGGGAPAIKPVKVSEVGDTGLVNWESNGGAVKGTDAFVVKHGKIQVQAVWMNGGPPAPPKS